MRSKTFTFRMAVIGATAGAALLAPLAPYAQAPRPGDAPGLRPGESYRCVGKDGKKYYGQAMPAECVGIRSEIINSSGLVVRRLDPQGDARDKAEREANAKEKAQRDIAEKEERRRAEALLATYTSEADIERARTRALAENKKAIADIELRTAAIRKRQAGYKRELEFYSGKNKPPARLDQDIKSAEIDLKALEDLRTAKSKEVDSINAKYDDDKRRYAEILSKR